MKSRLQKQINFLFENACASIRYLVHRDILGTCISDPTMRELQGDILKQPNIQKILSAQHNDGWFGHELHGIDGMDCLIGGLLNAGVEKDNPAIQKAICALVTPEIASQHKNWFRGGEALDAEGRGGNRAIVAQILSSVGYPETDAVLTEQIDLSFEHLSAILAYDSVDDFSIRGKNQRYYKPKAKFPGSNHIGLLASTQSWRIGDNIKISGDAIRHGYELMWDFDEYITFKKPSEFGGGFVGPFNYNWQALTPVTEEGLRNIINSSNHFQFGFWLGAVSGVPDWARQSTGTYELLADLLERDVLVDMVPDKTFKAFRQIMGREPSLRKKTAAKCDLTYAVLRACRCVIM